MHTKQNAPTNTSPPMNLLGPILYKFPPPWVTQRFPGWFKWDFKEYWKIRFSQMAKVYVPVVMDYWKGLFRTYTTTIVLKTLLESEAPQLQKHTGPRSFQIWIWHPKNWPNPTGLGVPSNFCFIKFLPKCITEAPEPHRPPWTQGQGRGCRTSLSNY